MLLKWVCSTSTIYIRYHLVIYADLKLGIWHCLPKKAPVFGNDKGRNTPHEEADANRAHLFVSTFKRLVGTVR